MRRTALVAAFGLLLAAHAAAEAPGVRVVARVGEDIITSADLDEAVAPVLQSMTPEERASPEGQAKVADARKNVLDHLIDEKLVILAAEAGPDGFADASKDNKTIRNPYLPENSDIETEMEKLFDQARESYGDQDAFEAALGREHLTVPEYRNRLREKVRDELTYEKMQKLKESEFRPSLHVSDDEAEAYYNDHKADFFQGAQVELRHILLPADDLPRAKRFLAVLKARPAGDQRQAFIDLARKYSADAPTKDQGGLLGWVEKGQSWPEIEAAAFPARDGSLVGPVRTKAGWHLLYVEGHRPGRQVPFAEVKADAANLVYQDKVRKRLQDWLDSLKTKYYVQRSDGAGA